MLLSIGHSSLAVLLEVLLLLLWTLLTLWKQDFRFFNCYFTIIFILLILFNQFWQAQGQSSQGPLPQSSGSTTVFTNNSKANPLAFLNPNGEVKAGSRNIHQPNVSRELPYKGVGDAFTRIYTEEGNFFRIQLNYWKSLLNSLLLAYL